jgi:hypothetical protein
MPAINPSIVRLKTLYIVIVFLYWASLYFYVPTLAVIHRGRSRIAGTGGYCLAMYGLWQAVCAFHSASWLIGLETQAVHLAGIGLLGCRAHDHGQRTSVEGMILGRAITGLAAASWVPMVVVIPGLVSTRRGSARGCHTHTGQLCQPHVCHLL